MSFTDTFMSITGATIFQQSSTYWVKTLVKNQYVYGEPIISTFKTLFRSTEPFRFYSGMLPTITKAIIGRNADILCYKFYLEKLDSNKEHIALISGLSASVIKVGFMPLDTISNLYQIHGKNAEQIIKKQYGKENYFFYRGTTAYIALTSIGSSVWLYTYSKLNETQLHTNKNINNALIGISASIMSDSVINPIRILKTYKQSHNDYITYSNIIKNIVKKDGGWLKSYFRGYGVRMCLNAFNSGLFMVLWKNFE